MDCRICMDDKITQNNILHLKCGHELCLSCYDKLIKNTCPYCREIIDDKVEGSYGNIDIDTDINDYVYDISTRIDNNLQVSEVYYIENFYYIEESYDIIHHRRRRRNNNNRNNNNNNNNNHNRNNHNRNNFVANCDREPHQRHKKKWKKKRH